MTEKSTTISAWLACQLLEAEDPKELLRQHAADRDRLTMGNLKHLLVPYGFKVGESNGRPAIGGQRRYFGSDFYYSIVLREDGTAYELRYRDYEDGQGWHFLGSNNLKTITDVRKLLRCFRVVEAEESDS